VSASLPSACEALEALAADLRSELEEYEPVGDYGAGVRAGLTVALDAVEQKATHLRAIEAEHVPGRVY
jgi:hypothetical protein